jgi:uncharacterized protein (UPF0332 family)
MKDDEIRALLRRARETLAAADSLPAVDPNSAASRAYYAAFYAVSALLGRDGAEFGKHSQVHAAVHRDLVHTGRWDVSLGRDFTALRTQRDVGDYGATMCVDKEAAEECVAAARRIVMAVLAECSDISEP